MPRTARRCQGRAPGPSLRAPRSEGVASSLPDSRADEAGNSGVAGIAVRAGASVRLGASVGVSEAGATSAEAGGSLEGWAVRASAPASGCSVEDEWAS